VENGILADNANSGTESKVVSSARETFQSIDSDLSGKKTELEDHKKDLISEYGPDGVFRALKGKCVSQDSGEYTYELCWMHKTTQKSKKGGAHTGMGDFASFARIKVDEEVSADGRGLGQGVRLALRYENGQHCWNGPARQTTVILACAEKDEIWKVVEEEKCIYRMEVGSPAACDQSKPQGGSQGRKDEL
jgi:protein kinase C substrate 80K-H